MQYLSNAIYWIVSHFYQENKLKSTGEQYICDEYVCERHGSPPDTDESIWDIIARGP